MLINALPEEAAQQHCVQVVYDDIQDVACIEVKLGDKRSLSIEHATMPSTVFLVFELTALHLLLELDSNVLRFWLNVLDLREIYIYFTEQQRDDILAMAAKLQKLGMSSGSLVLGVPATEAHELMLRFGLSDAVF